MIHPIRDYLHQIDVYDRKVKRIRKIKYLVCSRDVQANQTNSNSTA